MWLLSTEMGRHIANHGDGVKDIAFEVEDCASIYKVEALPFPLEAVHRYQYR